MSDRTADTKICPFCAEEIKVAAVKCRYCQSDLSGSPAGPAVRLDEVETPAEPAPPLRRSRLPLVSPKMLVVLLVLSIVAAGIAGKLAWDVHRMQASNEARTAGQITAADYVERLLSYSYKTFDKDEVAQKKLTTGKFATQYARTMKLVSGSAQSTQTIVKATVVASSVISAEPDEVRALLFVNQTTTGKQVRQPRVDQNRVVVTLTKDGNSWLISNLDAL
jgi:hypothetical protein